MITDDPNIDFKVTINELLDSINDKDDSVNNAIQKSICKLTKPANIDAVILAFCDYLKNKAKLRPRHVENILSTLEKICLQNAQCLNKDITAILLDEIIKEMVSSNDYIPTLQIPASGVLVAIGRYHCNEVIEPLMNLLQPGVIPHFTIPHTMGALALNNFKDLRPFIKNILAKILPTLGMLKSDPIRQAFSYAVGNFATGLIDSCDNYKYANNSRQISDCENDLKDQNERTSDAIEAQNINESKNYEVLDENLSTEFSIIFDILFSHWLYSNEHSVIENVLQAMGPMVHLITIEKLTEMVPKLIPTMISIYKKVNVNPYYVTQSMAYILSKSVKTNLLSPSIIELVNITLFGNIITLPDYDQSQKVKNHFETLRCFDILLKSSSNVTLEFLLLKSKSNYDEDKMKTIVILTHLVVSSDMDEITQNFKLILKENLSNVSSIKMKQILLKGIVALAYKKVPFEEDNVGLIEFIIKNISSNDFFLKEQLYIDNFYKDCESSLYLLISTVPHIKTILLPLLLKALMTSNSNSSISIITKCLSQLMQSEDTDVDSISQFNSINIPSNESIFTRCLSLLNYNAKDKMYHNIINFLLKYCIHIHKDLAITWEVDLKNLSAYLDTEEFSTDIWENMILDVFRSAIYSVNDNRWVDLITQNIVEQIPFMSCISQKGILFKFLAILLCNMIDNNNLENKLNILFDALPNCAQGEEKYIAQSMGISSIKHGILIIEKLDNLCKAIDSKKMNRFLKFNFMKNPKQDLSLDNMRYILTLCYCEISKEVLDINILERLVRSEKVGFGKCINWIIDILKNKTSSINLIQASLNTLYYLAKAIDSISHSIILHERWELLNLLLDQISDGVSKLGLEHYPMVIKTISALTSLPKPLSPEERNAIFKILNAKLFNIIINKNKNKESEPLENDFPKILEDIQISLDIIIMDFLIQSTCPSTLDDMFGTLDEWIVNDCNDVRITAIKSVHSTLNAFIKNIKLTYENPSRFNQSGFILGRIVPKCTDKNPTVRIISVDCIKIIIQIIDLYEGHTINPESEKKFTALHSEITSNNSKNLPKVLSQIGEIISEKIQHQQVLSLIESILSYSYVYETCELGCSIILDIIFKTKGADLFQNVEDVMNVVLSTLPNLTGTAKESLLQNMLIFTKHHPKTIVNYLLGQSLPFETSVNECWSTLAQDSTISTLTFDILLNILTTHSLFEEIPKYENDRVASVQSLAAICAMCEMLSQVHTKRICEERFSDFFSTLYTIIICFNDVSPPAYALSPHKKQDKFGFVPNIQSTRISPLKIVIETLKALLINSNCIKIIDVFLMCSELDSTTFLNHFLDIVSSAVKIFCEDYPQHLPKLVTSLNQFSRSSLIPQRIAVVAFFSHLVTFRCNDNPIILETIISALNGGWKDTALEVRAISLFGLSNVIYLKKEHQDQQIESVISALYHGLDDYQGSTLRTNIPLVAIVSLTKFLVSDSLTKELMELYIKIALRIKAFMNTDNPILREASIHLFGEIELKHNSESLKEQAFNLLPCFLLHLADEDENVVKACKQTLRKISPTYDAPNTNTMIQTHLIDTAKLHITEFITDLTKCISNELPQNIPQLIENTFNYLNSPWDNIRANAAVMIGLLFTGYQKDDMVDNEYDKIKKMVTFRLLQLLKDKVPNVRISAAKAISCLY